MAPEASVHTMLKRLYPYDVMLGKEGQNAVLDALSVSITFKLCSISSGPLMVAIVHI